MFLSKRVASVASVWREEMAHTAIRDAQRMVSRYAEDIADDMESWKVDHHAAMRCRDFEGRLIFLNGLIELFFDLRGKYEASSTPGVLRYDPSLEDQMEQALERLSSACRGLESRIRDFEKQGFAVDGADDFRSLRTNVETFLAEARRIRGIEGRMGLRGVTMNPEDSAAFRAMLDEHVEKSSMPAPPVSPTN